ncbi:MAG: TIM barrel protein [Candidatus Saccharicenans sp.]|nr:TIM barrel protein [Candidatus Saccharicenans sp.]
MRPAAEKLLFGTAGVPLSCPEDSSARAVEEVRRLGLEALELEFVQGLNMGTETAGLIRTLSRQHRVKLSAHAPYFINLNSPEAGKKMQSQKLLLSSLRLAAAAGASDLVFHGGYYGACTPEETLRNIKNSLREILSIVRSENIPVRLRIETTGKKKQFGSLDEVLSLCRELEGLWPCLDFAHIYAREGKVNSYDEFCRVLNKVEKKLGRSAIKNAHIHISGVRFNQSGELKHLNLEESDFRFDEWLQALVDLGVAGTVICESPALESEALMLKNLYKNLRSKKSASEQPAET